MAAGCGASLGGRYDSPTTAPPVAHGAGTTASTLRVVTAQPLPSLDPAFASTRQSRAVANALCTPLVRYADAEGLPRNRDRARPRARPARDRARQSHAAKELLVGLRFSDGSPLTADDVKATFERLLDPATGSPGAALFNEIVGAKTFRAGDDAHLSGVRVRGAWDHDLAEALRSRLPGPPGHADRVPGTGRARPP